MNDSNPLKKKFGAEFFRNIPESCGIYFMADSQGGILYIGKAKSLRRRLSTYSQIRSGYAPDSLWEMIQRVEKIGWQECATEKGAFLRESELLHAIRPPFNTAQTEPENYLFIGVKESKRSWIHQKKEGLIPLEFLLTGQEEIQRDGYQLYGCFKHRRKTKQGYSALLRLIYASVFEGKRFMWPSRIAAQAPCWSYSLNFPLIWRTALDSFLRGQSMGLLHEIFNKLMSNDGIPGFFHASIQDDFQLAQVFFETGPEANQSLFSHTGLTERVLSHSLMDDLIASEFKKSI